MSHEVLTNTRINCRSAASPLPFGCPRISILCSPASCSASCAPQQTSSRSSGLRCAAGLILLSSLTPNLEFGHTPTEQTRFKQVLLRHRPCTSNPGQEEPITKTRLWGSSPQRAAAEPAGSVPLCPPAAFGRRPSPIHFSLTTAFPPSSCAFFC